MKKFRKPGYVILCALVLVLGISFASTALAALVTKTIQVASGVNIYIDGEKFYPKDVNGNPVEAFIYDGTTYLPIRAVGEAYGMELRWEGSTGSVYIDRHDEPSAPVIKSVELFGKDGNPLFADDWIFLQAKSIIKVEYEGKATQADFYVVPTGTETTLLQQLIGRVHMQEDAGTAELEWVVPEGFMGYIWVIVYNGDVARTSDTDEFFIKAVYELPFPISS